LLLFLVLLGGRGFVGQMVELLLELELKLFELELLFCCPNDIV